MAKTYKRHATARGYRQLDIGDGGISALSKQQQPLIEAQRFIRDRQYSQDIEAIRNDEKVQANEAANRDDLRNLYKSADKAQEAGRTRNIETERKSLNTKLDYLNHQKAKWKNFSEVKVKEYAQLAQGITDKIQQHEAKELYTDLIENGQLNKALTYWETAFDKNDKTDKKIAQAKFKALKDNKLDEVKYLSSIHSSNNKWFHRLLVDHIVDNIDIIENDLKRFHNDPANKTPITPDNVHSIYLERANKLVQQFNLGPKSYAALKITKLFSQKAGKEFTFRSRQTDYHLGEKNKKKHKKILLSNINSATLSQLQSDYGAHAQRTTSGYQVNSNGPIENISEMILDLANDQSLKGYDGYVKLKKILSQEVLGYESEKPQILSVRFPELAQEAYEAWEKAEDKRDEVLNAADKAEDKKANKLIELQLKDGTIDLSNEDDRLVLKAKYQTAGEETKKTISEALNYQFDGKVSWHVHENVTRTIRDNDFAEFMYHYRNLPPTVKERYTPEFERLNLLNSTIEGEDKNIKERAEKEVATLIGQATIDETKDPSAYAAARALTQQFYYEVSRLNPEDYKNNPNSMVGDAWKAALEDLKSETGLFKVTRPDASGSSNKVVFDHFDYKNGPDTTIGYDTLIKDVQTLDKGASIQTILKDIKPETFITEDEMGSLLKAITIGRDVIPIPKNVTNFVEVWGDNMTESELTNLILEQAGMNERVPPSPREVLKNTVKEDVNVSQWQLKDVPMVAAWYDATLASDTLPTTPTLLKYWEGLA